MRLLGIALTVFMLQTVSASQQQMGSIEGRVMSAAGGVLPKAKVTLIGPNASMQFPPTALAQAGQTLLEADRCRWKISIQ